MYTSSGLNKNSAQDEDSQHLYDLCAYIPNVELATGGHFSISAATGAVAGKLPPCPLLICEERVLRLIYVVTLSVFVCTLQLPTYCAIFSTLVIVAQYCWELSTHWKVDTMCQRFLSSWRLVIPTILVFMCYAITMIEVMHSPQTNMTIL